MMNKFKTLSIVLAVIALIGLVSFIAGTRHVNFGAFLFPAVLAVVFAVLYVRKSREAQGDPG